MAERERPAVIVTGSAGLIGKPVCQRLEQLGYEVFGLDRIALPDWLQSHAHLHSIDCDVTDDASVQNAVRQVRERAGERLASVVHLAAYYDFSGEDSELYEQVTIEGTQRLLKTLRDLQIETEQFLFTSTMLVHAPCDVGQHIHEEDPLLAKWPYPASKIETERLIRESQPSLRSVFLRIGGIYTDYGQQPTLVQQIKRIHEKDFQGHFFPGNTDAGQSAVHIDDAVDAIARAVERRKAIEPQTAILVGEPDPPSYSELQDAIGQQMYGKEWVTLYVPKSVAKVGAAVSDKLSGGESFIKPFMISMADDHYALDVGRAQKLLGWEPQHQLMDTMPTMVESLQKNPDEWYRRNGLER